MKVHYKTKVIEQRLTQDFFGSSYRWYVGDMMVTDIADAKRIIDNANNPAINPDVEDIYHCINR